jgi:hypothetical protein
MDTSLAIDSNRLRVSLTPNREDIMKLSVMALCCVCLGAVSQLPAQELPAFPKPQKEHEWLQKFVGEWESESEASMGPDQPAMKCKGTMSSRMLGGFWVVSEVKADMPGVQVNAIQTIGYDEKSKKYVGTWVDSMMNYMWKYEGTVEGNGTKLILEAEGPNFTQPGKTSKFRDAYEFKSKDHIVATSSMLGDDGKWVTFMTGNMRRKKQP